ncbi:MAG: hypothetical protein FJW40_25480 [Acidobacteria bacterium]|nr:hypothetical protein [Acidobacteriota bacterium]
MNVASSRHSFKVRLAVLNNFRDEREFRGAEQAARRLVSAGLADAFIHAPTHLTEERLRRFGLDPAVFRAANPYFSTSHLAALDYLRDRTEWMFFLNGDVWLERECAWVERAQGVLARQSRTLGLNLCRNIYRSEYPACCHVEDDDLWLSTGLNLAGQSGPPGFTLSDHAYFIPVNGPSPGGWRFGFTDIELAAFHPQWPTYARPCFEMLYAAAQRRDGFKHAALKPLPGGPVTKHKTFPKSRLKFAFHRLCGHYAPQGKYATRPVPSA